MKSQKPQPQPQEKATFYPTEFANRIRADERAKMQIQYREEIRTFKELCEKRLGRLLMDIVEHAQELVNRTFENKAELKEIK